MKRLIIVPDGWPCTLEECRPGHFVLGEQLCYKSEYFKTSPGDIEAFNCAGEYLSVPPDTTVQPADYEWVDE